ncbi:family S53 protease-like protein [Lentinus tigrinus ALCF2SS1-7]|uniref:family S53 protease-like protein n=1 Tax=Lentinus tigrinus ALCF2SS1-7 TaxID=1328758 RepID=UPI001165E3D4|nr:family S53 protease-like protein [Lentinus tigrinus ALCF2SS1-7]
MSRPTSKLAVRSSRAAPPAGFAALDTTGDPIRVLRLSVALPLGNVDGLHSALLDVSDPKSANYGRHKSKTEVEQLVAPRPESVKAVMDWLSSNSIAPSSISPSGDMVTIELPVDRANALLDANFTTYVHNATNATLTRTLSYSLPADLEEHVSFVYPTTQFILPSSRLRVNTAQKLVTAKRLERGRSKRAGVATACSIGATPECLQALYNIPATPATASGNAIAVSGFLDEVPNSEDLENFPDTANGTFQPVSVNGGLTNGTGTSEASLDIQYTVGLATGVPTAFISVGGGQGTAGDSPFLDEISFLLQQEDLPTVMTTSFAGDEEDDVEFAALVQTICNGYAQLGLRGMSVIFASGDGGVAGASPGSACSPGQSFIGSFPSDYPYVTSVGATQRFRPEVAAPFSSGGFSNVFARPDYQVSQVESYLKALGDTNTGLFNASGRAYPDVSFQGVDFPIVQDGQLNVLDGTSASSPGFASMVALINDQLLNAGKPPLGFLNPFLYSQAAAGAFNDITSGSNPGCGTEGFPALPGWDPVTGLGTPDFQKLLAVAMSSPQ